MTSTAQKKPIYFYPSRIRLVFTGVILFGMLSVFVWAVVIDTRTLFIREFLLGSSALGYLLIIFCIWYYGNNTYVMIDEAKVVFKQPINPTRVCQLSEISKAAVEDYGEDGSMLKIYLNNNTNIQIRGAYSNEQYSAIIDALGIDAKNNS